MSSLPTPIQPLWPLFKSVHRMLARGCGTLFRAVSPLLRARGLPRTATERSSATVAAEPHAVSLHEAGPAEMLSRGPARGSPSRHWRFVEGETAKIPPRYVLDVRGGRLVGEYGATVTPGGVLDYQTSGYFGIAGWREHPMFLRPTLGSIEDVEGTVLSLTARGTAANYYHFMFDAIARFGIFEEALPGTTPDAVIVPHQTGYQRQLLEMAGVPGPYLQPGGGRTYRAERLLVPSTPNQDLDAPRWVVDWLRGRLPPTRNESQSRRLYLSRGNRPRSRRYTQEAELLPHLERRGFEVLDPGSLSVQEQIDTFHSAEIVVAPHGAGLTNITFCMPGAKVLELFAGTYVHLGLWTIADAVGLDYRYLVADGPVTSRKEMVGILDDVSIPVERVVAAVDQLLG